MITNLSNLGWTASGWPEPSGMVHLAEKTMPRQNQIRLRWERYGVYLYGDWCMDTSRFTHWWLTLVLTAEERQENSLTKHTRRVKPDQAIALLKA